MPKRALGPHRLEVCSTVTAHSARPGAGSLGHSCSESPERTTTVVQRCQHPPALVRPSPASRHLTTQASRKLHRWLNTLTQHASCVLRTTPSAAFNVRHCCVASQISRGLFTCEMERGTATHADRRAEITPIRVKPTRTCVGISDLRSNSLAVATAAMINDNSE